MCRCNVTTIAVVIAASMVLLLDRKVVIFALNAITVTAFTTTANSIWSYPRRSPMSSTVWSIPPSHHAPHVSKQHDDVVSIKNLSATGRRSFMQPWRVQPWRVRNRNPFLTMNHRIVRFFSLHTPLSLWIRFTILEKSEIRTSSKE